MRGPRNKQHDAKIGAIVLGVIVVLCYLGFTKANPFAKHYDVKAAFSDIVTLKAGAPVRIAGVNVGKVTNVEAPEDGRRGAIVTLRINDEGLPLNKDVRVKIRPRIFLEGNTFVDVQPGTPAAGTLQDGGMIPATQTASPVGFGQVLQTLQKSTREDLRIVLAEYGAALRGSGAKGFNRSVQYWEGAYRDSAIVGDALRGTEPNDLSGYIGSAGIVAAALDKDPAALKGLITNFAITAGAFASEQNNLRQAIATLPETLDTGYAALGSLNEAFPPFRRLISALRPTVRESGPALDAQLPLLKELRGLVSEPELGGAARDMRTLVPDLAELSRGTAKLQTQTRRLASCQLNTIIPTGNSRIDDKAFPVTGPVYEEGVKWLPGIAGESRSFDANGQYVKSSVRGGLNLAYELGDGRYFMTARPLQGVNPPKSSEPPLRPDVACETQDRPDLRSNPATPPTPIKIGRSSKAYDKRMARVQESAVVWLRRQLKLEGLSKTFKVVNTLLDDSGLRKLRAQARAAR